MEIDFLGLNSTANRFNSMEEQYGFKDTSIFTADAGSVETSLSLSMSPSFHGHSEILKFNLSEKNKRAGRIFPSNTEKQSLVFAPPPVQRPLASTAAGVPYNLNLRTVSEIVAEPASITILYEKAVPSLSGLAGIWSQRPGYTPTVAMARRATLARFLEKRLHRLTQPKKAHFMGKLMNAATDNPH